MTELCRVIGAPDETSPDLIHHRADMVLQEVQVLMADLPEVPQTNPDAFYPLEMMWHAEGEVWRRLMVRMREDCQYLTAVARGTLAGSPREERMLQVS